jgi:hypothetical protein
MCIKEITKIKIYTCLLIILVAIAENALKHIYIYIYIYAQQIGTREIQVSSSQRNCTCSILFFFYQKKKKHYMRKNPINMA